MSKARAMLDDFWDGIDKIFSEGPLQNLTSWEDIKKQSPGLVKSFNELQEKIKNDMSFDDLKGVIIAMADKFKSITLRYKNLNKISKNKEQNESRKEEDPFAHDQVHIVREIENADNGEDPFV